MRWLRGAVDRLATEWVILVVGWVAFLVYAFPGYMSYDSTWQLSQARHLEPINEWQPPMMSFIWHYADAIIAGPFPMLVIQSTAFLLGMRSVLGHVLSKRAAAAVAVLMILIPQNIVVMAVIWKDSQMAGFLVAAIAALLSRKRGWRIAGYGFLFLATGVRYNAAAPTLPIVLLLFAFYDTMPWWRRYATGFALWLGITAAALFANSLIVEKHLHPWQTAAAPLDIAGIIRFSPHLDNDQLLRDTPGVPWAHTDKIQIRIRAYYHPENQFLNITQDPGQVFEYPTTDAQLDAIASAWKKLVFAHPRAFLHHRVKVFFAQLRSSYGGAGGVFSGFMDPVYDELIKHRATHSAIQEAWIHKMESYDGGLMYKVGLYFWLAVALLPLCFRNRLAFTVIASGIMHMLGLLAVAPAVDYRYSQWMIACTILGAVIIAATRVGRAIAAPASS